MKIRLVVICAVVGVLALASCGKQAPGTNSPTSGRLIIFVDDPYLPLVKALADTFMMREPGAKIEIQGAGARRALQELLDRYLSDPSKSDTSLAVAAILGRPLLADERQAIAEGGLELKEYPIAYDGLAVAVAAGSPLTATTVEQLRAALQSPSPTARMLDSAAGDGPVRFILPDQNSSALALVRSTLLRDSNVSAPANYFRSVDSVLGEVALGKGVGIIGWYAAHRDSVRIRTLRLGYTDSTGAFHPPVRVHPTSLVTDAYPLKQPLIGYTFSPINSLAVGFLATVAKGAEAQRYLVEQGFQGENVRMRLVLPEDTE